MKRHDEFICSELKGTWTQVADVDLQSAHSPAIGPHPAAPAARPPPLRGRDKPQYLFAIGSSSAGNRVITRQPLSVTTTSSSMRAAE